MKNLLSIFTIAAALCFVSSAEAQRPGGGRGAGRGGPPPQGFNQGNFGGNQAQQRFGNQANQGFNQAQQQFGIQGFNNQAAANQNGNQNMPSVAQLAQMMIENFDADGSGELGQGELQNALSALRDRMQNRGRQQQNGFANQQDGLAAQQNSFGNQRNAFQGGQNLQANQARGNRPPRGQAGRRGR